MREIKLMNGDIISIKEEDFKKLEEVLKVKQGGLVRIGGEWINISSIVRISKRKVDPIKIMLEEQNETPSKGLESLKKIMINKKLL